MAGNGRLNTTSMFIVTFLALSVFIAPAAVVGSPQVEVWMPDTTVAHRATTVAIPVYVDNHSDTVSAFTLHVMLSVPGILAFPAVEVSRPDTSHWVCDEFNQFGVCTDSTRVPNDSVTLGCRTFDWRYITSVDVWEVEVDTVGTLVAGWDVVEAISLTGPEPLELLVKGMYDSSGAPYSGGIPYAEGSPPPLLWLVGELQDLADTLTDSTVQLQFDLSSLSDCSFTDPGGAYIAAATDTVPDTALFNCGNTWEPTDSCLYWLRTSEQPADSMLIVNHYLPAFDSVETSASDGSLTVTRDCCGLYTDDYTGNTNCSEDGKRTLSDITRLIDRVYVSKAELCCEKEGNTNGDPEGSLTLSDITRLIDHVYISRGETAPCQ
jgi:hypothetical protein